MLMDFDDLLVNAYQLLKSDDQVRQKYREIFRHLLVDEFQDTNPIQMEILTLLLPSDNGNDSSFWICGDDAQTHIWIHRSICRQHSQFQIDVPRVRADHLNLNYRSTPQILRACQNLIRHNEKQIQKALETENPDGDDVIVLESSSEETEALTVVNEIREIG